MLGTANQEHAVRQRRPAPRREGGGGGGGSGEGGRSAYLPVPPAASEYPGPSLVSREHPGSESRSWKGSHTRTWPDSRAKHQNERLSQKHVEEHRGQRCVSMPAEECS